MDLFRWSTFRGYRCSFKWSQLSGGSTFASLICVWFRQTGPICVFTRQALGAGILITSPKIHGCCLFVGLGFTYIFSTFENSLRGADALFWYCAFAFRLLSAVFCCTKLGDAACGTSRLGAVGMKSLSLLGPVSRNSL